MNEIEELLQFRKAYLDGFNSAIDSKLERIHQYTDKFLAEFNRGFRAATILKKSYST